MLRCLNISDDGKTALVQSNRTGRSFPVEVYHKIQFLIAVDDGLKVIKTISGDWMAIDYHKELFKDVV